MTDDHNGVNEVLNFYTNLQGMESERELILTDTLSDYKSSLISNL